MRVYGPESGMYVTSRDPAEPVRRPVTTSNDVPHSILYELTGSPPVSRGDPHETRSCVALAGATATLVGRPGAARGETGAPTRPADAPAAGAAFAAGPYPTAVYASTCT